MNIPFDQRLYTALKKRRLSPELQRAILADVMGTTRTPVHDTWAIMRAPLQAHIESLRSRAKSKHKEIVWLVNAYYDACVAANALIRAQDHSQPIPAGKERWQFWVPADVRADLTIRFDNAYSEAGTSGLRTVPFVPMSLRKTTLELIERAERAIASERRLWSLNGIGVHWDIRHALMLCACRMAERELARYKKSIKTGVLKPYEHPAKVNWRHYCTKDMRGRVRAALSGGFISGEGLDSFYDPDLRDAPPIPRVSKVESPEEMAAQEELIHTPMVPRPKYAPPDIPLPFGLE